MFYGAQPISQKLMVHHLLDLPFGCSDNIIVILLIIIIINIIIIIFTDNNNNNNNNTSRKYQRELL